MLYVITGHTLSGKTTLLEDLEKELGINRIVTYTNRPKRKNEKDGVDYHFITTEEIEKEEYFGKRYFYTAYREEPFIYGMKRDDVLLCSDIDSIMVSDPKGLRAIKDIVGAKNVTSIYIDCPFNEIKIRGILRGDSPDEIERRLEVDKLDFISAKYYADIVYDSLSFDCLVEKIKESY